MLHICMSAGSDNVLAELTQLRGEINDLRSTNSLILFLRYINYIL